MPTGERSSAPIRRVVGRTIRLDDVAHTIVGVMPRDFQYIRPYDVFTPMGPHRRATGELLDRGNHHGFYALGRLKAGVSVEAPPASCGRLRAALEREYPNTNSGDQRPGRCGWPDRLVDDVRLTLLALFGAVGFLLLIACVNVANLLVARGAARQHELAVRAALGGGRAAPGQPAAGREHAASRWPAARSASPSRAWLLRALVAVAPEGTPRIAEVRLDARGAAVRARRRRDSAASSSARCRRSRRPASAASSALVRGRAAGFAARSHRLRRGLMVGRNRAGADAARPAPG